MFPLRDSVPTRRFPFVNYALIAINIAIFIKDLQFSNADLLEKFIAQYGLVPGLCFDDPVIGLP